jgi:uncharacterized damage-inducible protein DinB
MSRTRLEIAVKNIEFARRYTNQLLEDIQADEWFRQPTEGVTHLAWQVGHLAMAQYALTMLRLRGKEPEDSELISNDFFRRFQKGTIPSDNPGDYPEPRQILDVFQHVHQRALLELDRYTDQELDVKLPEPHAVFDTKLGSVFFCSSHELIHAGQIGLLRRLLGKAPVR